MIEERSHYDDWLLRWTRHCIASGHMSREEARRGLVALRDAYSERGLTEEREIIADVLDAFDGWAPMKAQI